MEKSISASDYIIVDKFLFGTMIEFKKPHRFNSLFYVSIYDENMDDNMVIINGLLNVQNNDICVVRTMDKKRIVKRIIASPGDVVQIISDTVYLNNEQIDYLDEFTFSYTKSSTVISSKTFGIINYSQSEYMALSNLDKRKIRKLNDYTAQPYRRRDTLVNNWSIYTFGPVMIPRKDTYMIVKKELIEWYNNIRKSIQQIDYQYTKITFEEDAYFILGDNRHNSTDSRHLGPIPKSRLEGKVLAVIKMNF